MSEAGLLRFGLRDLNEHRDPSPVVLKHRKKVRNPVRPDRVQWQLLLTQLVKQATSAQPPQDQRELVFRLLATPQLVEPIGHGLRSSAQREDLNESKCSRDRRSSDLNHHLAAPTKPFPG